MSASHTDELWFAMRRVYELCEAEKNAPHIAVETADGLVVALTGISTTETSHISHANAERIAACVNACMGIPNHILTACNLSVLMYGFQRRVKPWMDTCFGPEISADPIERNHRFLEESLELVQACGCTASEAHQLVDYVFNRPTGDKSQEAGGVMVTLAALCLAQNISMHVCGEIELDRINRPEVIEKIRAKQLAKPKHSPLPESAK